MANTIDLYNKRTILRALEQMKPPRTFLLNTFFNFSNPQMHTTDAIDIDHCDHIAEALNNAGIKSAVLHSRSGTVRSIILNKFRAGDYQAVVSVAI